MGVHLRTVAVAMLLWSQVVTVFLVRYWMTILLLAPVDDQDFGMETFMHADFSDPESGTFHLRDGKA